MSWALKKKFNEPQELIDLWEKFIAPFVKELENGSFVLKDKGAVPHKNKFAGFCKCHTTTLDGYARDDDKKEFHDIMNFIFCQIEGYTADAGYMGSKFAKFALQCKSAWIPKTIVEQEGDYMPLHVQVQGAPVKQKEEPKKEGEQTEGVEVNLDG